METECKVWVYVIIETLASASLLTSQYCNTGISKHLCRGNATYFFLLLFFCILDSVFKSTPSYKCVIFLLQSCHLICILLLQLFTCILKWQDACNVCTKSFKENCAKWSRCALNTFNTVYLCTDLVLLDPFCC